MTRLELSAELVRFRDRSAVPAAAAAVVPAGGPTAFEVVGVRRRDGMEAVGTSGRWHIGSCTKAMTAALFARLVEEGRAEWHAPVAAFFPDLGGRMAAEWHERSIDDLLHCRGGMKPNLSPLQMRRGWADDAAPDEQRSRAARDALSDSPRAKGRFLYSNLGYIVAGAAIDRIAGMPYERALERYILEPLGMRSVGYGPSPDICGHRARLRLGSLLAFRGKPAEPGDPRSDNPPVLSSAGTLHLSMEDWSRFLRIFVSEGEPLLRSSSVDHLLKAPHGAGVPMSMGWVATPRSDRSSHVFQGSNTMWSATMLLSAGRDRVCLVACNDGRTSVLAKSAALAERLLDVQPLPFPL